MWSPKPSLRAEIVVPRIAIVTDSAACVPEPESSELGIHVVPFTLIWDDEAMDNGAVWTPRAEASSPAAFYRRFRASPTHPTTSQPSLGKFLALYDELARAHEGIVSVHVASELSGTCSTARAAATQIAPDRIRVLDSRTATIAEGFAVLAAARAAARDAPLAAVAAEAERVIRRVDFYATLKSLEHVHRGGRLGEAAALVGSRLSLVPVLNLREGRVSVISLKRAWQPALDRVLRLTLDRLAGKSSVHASVFHADALDDAERLRERLLARVACREFYRTEFTPVMGAHTGPGVVGIAFYADD